MKFLVAFCVLCIISFANCADKITIMSYNCYNYFVEKDADRLKSESSKLALCNIIKKANPDILLISEIGTKESLDDFMKYLKSVGCKYSFGKVMKGYDRRRHLGIISKIEPEAIIEKNNTYYNIKPKIKFKGKAATWLETKAVSRGFLHCIFNINGYKFHTILAHLKSKLIHKRYNQAEMRRYEARQLKYYVNDLLKLNKNANILIMGDMNDIPDSAPMKTLRSSSKKMEDRLYDLRPFDESSKAWTHWWNYDDSYARIDYILATYQILPEINFLDTKIIDYGLLNQKASDHRPILVTISPKEESNLNENKIKTIFDSNAIRLQTNQKE